MKSRILAVDLLLVVTMLVPAATQAQGEPIQIKLWHHGGPENEADANREQVQRFNASQDAVEVEYVEQPGGAVAGSGYNDAVNAAAVAGEMPCILDLDGPNLYNYAWAGFIIPWMTSLGRTARRPAAL
jgi:multiple sugar transport system substrate-binding protein